MAVADTKQVESQTKQCDCTHCGLPVPPGLVDDQHPEQFCCNGCRFAYNLIHANGLQAYYKLADNAGSSLFGKPAQDGGYREFDLPAFQERFCLATDGSIHKVALLLDGIHCAACIWLIEKLPQIVPGVVDVRLNWSRQTAIIRWRPDQVRLSQIANTLFQLGYPPHPIRESEQHQRRQLENRRHLTRIGIAGAAAGNNMLIAISLYLGMFSFMSDGMTQLLRIASCLVGLVSLMWPGRVFLVGAFNALRTKTPHMDLPIALALVGGTAAGLVNTIGRGRDLF